MQTQQTKRLPIHFPTKLKPLAQPSRYKVLHGGRGGAKSWSVAKFLLLKGVEKPIRVLCAREVQKSIKDSVHQLLADQIATLGMGHKYEILETEIRGTNGTSFIFSGLSSQTAASIKSFEGIDYCWVEEAQKVTRKSWDILQPTIRKPGSEILITFNPELDTDETWVRFVENAPQGAVVVQTNYSDNEFLPKVLEDERKEFLRLVGLGVRTQDDYENIWEGKCRAAVEGAIYYREVSALKSDNRIRADVGHEELLKVHTVWDLGWNDRMAILLVQKAPGAIRVIEYIEGDHRTLAEYSADLRTRPYKWGRAYLPHDGRAKDYRSGKSAEEILSALGWEVAIVENITVEDGIKAARLMFPRCWFNKDKAGLLVNRLGRYRRAVHQTTNEPGAPLHDENSHGSDGFRYLAVAEKDMSNDDFGNYDPYKTWRS